MNFILNFNDLETNKNIYRRALRKYVPTDFLETVVQLLVTHPVKFKIVKSRKTKLGDFRASLKNQKHQITVNGDLNPYSFLITTLHEFAHLITFNEYGPRVNPHGKEWKQCYSKLMLPIIDSKKLPHDIEVVLTNSLINVKASSCSDQNLQRVLTKYNPKNTDFVTLESLEKNSIFVLNGKTLIKGQLRRTRFICSDRKTNKQFLVNALAEVKEIKNEE